MQRPPYLYRSDDGARFTLQPDGQYTMDLSCMARPWRYSLEKLRECGFLTVAPTKQEIEAYHRQIEEACHERLGS